MLRLEGDEVGRSRKLMSWVRKDGTLGSMCCNPDFCRDKLRVTEAGLSLRSHVTPLTDLQIFTVNITW